MCAKRSQLTHPDLRVKVKLGTSPRTRKLYLIPECSPELDFGVHNSSINNLQRGVLERVFYVKIDGTFQPPPKPLPSAYKQHLGLYKTRLVNALQSTPKWSTEQFVQSYTGRKRTIYQAAVDSLVIEEFNDRDANLKVFVKAEKVNFSAKPDAVPRVISPRDPRFNVELGCYLRPLEHALYNATTSVFGSKTIFKGLNATQAGALFKEKWDRFRNPVAIGLDASRFDQHCSVEALEWEHSIYKAAFPNDRHLTRLLKLQLHNKAAGYCDDGNLKFDIRGGRASGDMNTGCGNCMIMCGLVHSYMAHKGVRKYEVANNGDDVVVIIEKHQLSKFMFGLSEWFVNMGFTMQVEEPVYELEQIEFCQAHPVFDGVEWTMVRNVATAISKDVLSIKPLDNIKIYQKWLTAVGDAGLSLTQGYPVMDSFYRCHQRNGGNRRSKLLDDLTFQTGLMVMAKGMDRQAKSITPEARYSFWMAFGLTPDEQIELEKHYDGLTLEYAAVPDELPRFMPVPLLNTN